MNKTRNKKIFVFGSSGHAKVAIDTIEKQRKHEILGIIDSFKSKGETFCGYDVMGSENDIQELLGKGTVSGCFLAIGDNWSRYKVYKKILEIAKEIEFIRAIHPSAQVAKDVLIKNGTIVMPGVVINSGSEVNSFCILNTNSSLDHDCQMGDFSSLAPNVGTGGNVQVGDFTAISIGANIINKVSIGKHCVIGAGATILSNIPDFSLAYGVPAKIIRKRKIGEKYI